MNKSLQVIILAAGKGTRMYSNIPKVLHQLAGKALVEHVIDCAESLNASSISLIYGHGGEQVKSLLTNKSLIWCEQKEQLGTGHAVQQAITSIDDNANVLILYADIPLLSATTLIKLLEAKQDSPMALLTANLPKPQGYGRIVRNDNAQITIGISNSFGSKTFYENSHKVSGTGATINIPYEERVYSLGKS